MERFLHKIRRRLAKSVLEYGVIMTVFRCLFWPVMYMGWRLAEWTPYARKARAEGAQFDETFGVDTERNRAEEWDADIESESWADGVGYDPTPLETVRGALGQLRISYEDFTFLDIGSGKGRVLLVASEFPFQEIIGVEYAPDLNEIAARNIEVFSSSKQKCPQLRSVCGDAATFSLPPTPLILFLHHPFGAVVMKKFMQNLSRSIAETPRKVYVVYYDPICSDILEEIGFREYGSRDLGGHQFLPEFVYTRLRWFELIGFRNRKGKEFVIYETA